MRVGVCECVMSGGDGSHREWGPLQGPELTLVFHVPINLLQGEVVRSGGDGGRGVWQRVDAALCGV